MLLSADIEYLENKWKILTFDLEPNFAQIWFSFIIDKYSESHRFYHNLTHIQSLLEYAEKYRIQIENTKAIQWAIWFHDIVYNPQSKENELNSNKVWLDFVQEIKKIEEDVVQLVQAMILGSAQHSLDSVPQFLLTKNDKDILSFFDLDLSILSADPPIYEQYAKAIRKEYIHIPDTIYKEGRAKVLEYFLSRKIYHSTPFKVLELQAQTNMKQELMKLKNI